MRIFAVSGVKDSGKTYTLNYLAQLLDRIGKKIVGPNPMTHPLRQDTRYIFDNVNGHKVGVGTSGDDGWTINEHFNVFDTYGCNVVIVACRSLSGATSVGALERQAIRRNCIVDYTTLMWEPFSPRHVTVEQTIAQRIANRI